MNDESTIVDVILGRQKTIRRQLDKRQISMKAVSFDSGISYPTLLTYFPADEHKRPAQIPGSAIYALTGKIPNDLLSLLLPSGFLVVGVPEDIDHDEFEEGCRDFLAAKGQAHHPNSPAGREIAACEKDVLDRKVVALRAA